MKEQSIDFSDVSDIFKILANKSRVRLILLLAGGGLSYTSIIERMGNPPTGTLNFHLNKLAPLIEKSEDMYSLNDTGKKAIGFIETYIHKAPLDTIKKEERSFFDDFFHLPEKYILLIYLGVFLIPMLFEYIESPVWIVNSILIASSAIAARFLAEKMYQSKRPRSTLFVGIISAGAMYLLYITIIIGIISNQFFKIVEFIVFDKYDNIAYNNIFYPDYSSLYYQTLRSVLKLYPVIIDSSTQLMIFGLGTITGFVIARYQYGEFPSMIKSPDITIHKLPHVVNHTEEQFNGKVSLLIFIITLFLVIISITITIWLEGLDTENYLFVRIEYKLSMLLITGSVQYFALRKLNYFGTLKHTMLLLIPTVLLELFSMNYFWNKMYFRTIYSNSNYRFNPNTDNYYGLNYHDLPNIEVMIFIKFFIILLIFYSEYIEITGHDSWDYSLFISVIFLIFATIRAMQLPFEWINLALLYTTGIILNILISHVFKNKFAIMKIWVGFNALLVIYFILVLRINQFDQNMDYIIFGMLSLFFHGIFAHTNIKL